MTELSKTAFEFLTWAKGGENPHRWNRNHFTSKEAFPTHKAVEELIRNGFFRDGEPEFITDADTLWYAVTKEGEQHLWDAWLANGGSLEDKKPMVDLEPWDTFKFEGKKRTVIGKHTCKTQGFDFPGTTYICCSDGWERELSDWETGPEVTLVRKD
jgi:hypothetical protein